MLHPFNALGEHTIGGSNRDSLLDAGLIGTSVSAGTSGAEGSWTSCITATSHETTWASVEVMSAPGGISTAGLLDIGFDPAGGTSYVEKISNLLAGNAGSATGYTGCWYLFPLKVPSGARVAARVAGKDATSRAYYTHINLFGRSSRPETMFNSESMEVVGTITGSGGVSVTPGNATWGSWVSLGTTAALRRWWQFGVQLDNAAMTTKYYYAQLAHGGATNKHIIKTLALGNDINERVGEFCRSNQIFEASHWPLPAGTELWARMMCDGAPDSGWSALAYGM